VSRIDLVGARFDPRLARAVGTRQDAHADPGIVLEEVQAGYLWDDELLRSAGVIVNRSGVGDSES
jgi:molecular chaperone GrpE